MGNLLSNTRREEVWVVLSELFSDYSAGVDWVAAQIADLDTDLVKEVFFNEVVPVCCRHSMALASTFFEREELIRDIHEMITNTKSSVFANLWHKINVAQNRFFLKDTWEELAAKLAEHRAAHQTEAGGNCRRSLTKSLM